MQTDSQLSFVVFLGLILLFVGSPVPPSAEEFTRLSENEMRSVTGQEGLTFTGNLNLNMDAAVFHDASGANGSNNDGFLIMDEISVSDNNYDFTLDSDGSQGLVLGVEDFDYVDITIENVCLDFMTWAECFREPAFEANIENLDLGGTELQFEQTGDGLADIDGELYVEMDQIELEDSDGYKGRSGGSWIFDGIEWHDGDGGPISFISPAEVEARYDGLRITAPDMSSFSNEFSIDMMRSSATSGCFSDCPSWEFHGMDPDGSWVELSGLD